MSSPSNIPLQKYPFVLDNSVLQRCYESLVRWFPTISYQRRYAITLFFKNMIRHMFANNTHVTKFIQDNVYKLDKLLNNHVNTDMYIFGIILFFSGNLVSLYINGDIKNEERIINIVLLYILVDNILDENDPSETKPFIKTIRKVLDNDVDNVCNNRPLDDNLITLHPSIRYYRNMVNGEKNAIIATKELFESEVMSVSIQTNQHLTREQYMHICCDKGTKTGILLYHIITDKYNEEDRNAIGHVGYCCQLIDDIMDCHQDIGNNINTIATYDYKREGHLDRLFCETVLELDNIPCRYNLLRYAFMLVLLYEISKHRLLSQSLRRKIDPHIYMNYIFGVDPFEEAGKAIM
jgi:hypothetical protein